jgi:hypothetical protein
VERKVLKLGEVEPLDGVVGEVAFSNIGKAKSGGEAEGGRRR